MLQFGMSLYVLLLWGWRKDLSSVKIQIRKCGFAWDVWMKSPPVVAQYWFVDRRDWSMVRAYFLVRKIVKNNPTKSAIYRWFLINFRVSGHLFKKCCMCFRTWSSWRSSTTWITFKSSHPALYHLNILRHVCVWEIQLHFCEQCQAIRVFLYRFSSVKNKVLRSLDDIHEKHNSHLQLIWINWLN